MPLRAASEIQQATGVKVGEVTDSTAIVWARLTANANRNDRGIVIPRTGKGNKGVLLPKGFTVDVLEGACPGAPGRVRIRYGRNSSLRRSTEWVDVASAADFSHQFQLTGLEPATVYYYAVETTAPGGAPVHGALRGRFETAPRRDEPADVRFTVITGMMYKDLDDRDGFLIYDAMARLQPQFLVATGDTVYYDNDDLRANTPALARYHWHRMYSLRRLVEFHRRVPAYWMKDDHDTLDDDCWPGRNRDYMLPMTFEEGQRIFREQVPMGERTWRTFRWGKGLQVWLPEGRDFRSPNNMEDGPDKTIWGAEQRRWLEDSIAASDADWRVLVHPTPIVGPDRKKKRDNHANAAFATEGDAFRRWVRDNVVGNFFIACGDRHWQYHSVHPETGVQEFSCGPASDEHAGGSPGRNPAYHRFHRVKGGFLSVSVQRSGDRSVIMFRLYDVGGRVVYRYKQVR
jgi:alkaline phosphatase D